MVGKRSKHKNGTTNSHLSSRKSKRKKDKDVVTESLALLKTGVKMKKWKFNRDELYDRY